MSIGIDWLSVSFAAIDWDRRHGLWDRHASEFRSGYSMGKRAMTMTVGSAVVTVAVTSGRHGQRGHLQFNPSRVLYPGSTALCDVRQALEALDNVWEACTEVVTPACSMVEADLKRVDVATDIEEVVGVPGVLASLSRVHARGATMRSVFLDPPTGEATTVYAGSKSGGTVRAYDLGRRHGSRRDVIRVEVQGRTWLRTVADIRTVADLADRSAARLFHDRFRWAGFDLPISAPVTYLSLLDGVTDKAGRPWSTTKKDSYLGHLLAAHLGSAGCPSSSTLADYRRAIREIGLPDLGGLTTTGAAQVRLSLEHGRLISAAHPKQGGHSE